MTAPSQGRVVLVRGLPNFGTDVHCGLIQRVWNHLTAPEVTHDGYLGLVNVVIFPDGGAPQNLTNVQMYETKEQAYDRYAQIMHTQGRVGAQHVAYWPPRV